MAYKHIAVRELTKQTDHSHTVLIERIEEAKAGGWDYWLDAVPVSRAVCELGTGIRKAYPFVKFYATTANTLCRWEGVLGCTVWCASEIFVAIDTCPYTLLKIGYGQYHTTAGNPRYIVNARGIHNTKYAEGREQYSMRITNSLKSAVKNALANLLPYTIGEIAEHDYSDYHSKSVNISLSKAAQLPTLLRSITHSVLLNEVRALKAMGVTFTTPEFCGVADNCDEAAKVANEERNKRVDAVLMHFVEHSNGVVAECVSMQNIRPHSAFKVDSSETYALNDVPQAYQDKVAVLQTLPPGDHVDGVGMKVEEMLYWVEK